MRQGNVVDDMIRSVLQVNMQTEEPSAQVRDSLLANAAHDLPRSALGPSIPAIVSGLQESDEQTAEWNEQVITSIPLARRQLLLLAAPLYAVR